MNLHNGRIVTDFCMQNDVKIFCFNQWQTGQFRLLMRRNGWTVERYIDYDLIPTFLITPTLNGMLSELEKLEKGEAPGNED